MNLHRFTLRWTPEAPICLLVCLLLQACTTTYIVEHGVDRGLENHLTLLQCNSVLKEGIIGSTNITLTDETTYCVKEIQIRPDSTYFVDDDGGLHTIPSKTIASIEQNNRLAGALDGFLIGLTIGIPTGIVGGIIYASNNSGSIFGFIGAFYIVKYVALAGEVIGFVTDAVKGHRTSFEFASDTLQAETNTPREEDR